jgi:ATP-binding cassette subfamily B protein
LPFDNATAAGCSDRHGSRLRPGSEHPWPDQAAPEPDLALLEGEIALIGVLRTSDGVLLRRRSLGCWEAPCRLPALLDLPAELELRFKVIRAALLLPFQGSALQREDVQACLPVTLPTIEELLLQLAPPSPTSPASSPPFCQPPSHPPSPSPSQPGPAEGSLETLVHWLAQRHGTRAVRLVHPPPEPLDRLRALLERAGLIAVPLRLEPADLDRDCGDLILFGPAGPLLLLSEPQGYWLRDPAVPARPARRWRRSDLDPAPAPWQALGVSPSLGASDVSAAALLRFCFGPATQPATMLIAGTGLGLAMGFLLAIGQEGGAARWIFSLGGAGALVGLALALLSHPLRSALITALLGTLLGLLIPTFNTLLTNQALPDHDLNLMLQMAALLLAAALADMGLRWSGSSTLISVQQRGGHRLQLAALHRLLKLPPSFFQQYQAGELGLRFEAFARLQEGIRLLLSGGALQAVLSSVFLLFMLRISLPLTGLAIVVALALVGPTLLLGPGSLRLERQRAERQAEAASRNLELINSVSKLRLAGVEQAACQYWWEPYREAIGCSYRLQSRSALAALLQTVLPNLGVLLLFLVITRPVAEAALDPWLGVPNGGELLGFLAAFTTFLGAVGSTAAFMVQAFELPVLLERARPILAATPEGDDPNRLEPGLLRGGVELDAVHFRYTNSGPWVLDGLDLRIRPGEFVAVVGPSGSGKSTLVRLLLGLDQPQKGTIRFDGRPLDRLRLDLVRRQIGVVPQNASLMAGSILEVIAGGAQITSEQAWTAAEQAAMASEIRALPMGMHTILSEGGGNLSGGQRQRLAIARALVRQPALLILDEATSALDNRSQAAVGRQLQQLGLTRIVIAHRLSTIRHADRIVMLEDGRISEAGTYQQLISCDGPFAAMMRLQAGGELP